MFCDVCVAAWVLGGMGGLWVVVGCGVWAGAVGVDGKNDYSTV